VQFDWDAADDGNASHILREHGLEPDQVEEVFLDPRRQPIAAYQVPGERRRGESKEAALYRRKNRNRRRR
jgi:hypothetical protein